MFLHVFSSFLVENNLFVGVTIAVVVGRDSWNDTCSCSRCWHPTGPTDYYSAMQWRTLSLKILLQVEGT